VTINFQNHAASEDLLTATHTAVRKLSGDSVWLIAYGSDLYSLEIDGEERIANQTSQEMTKVLAGMLMTLKYVNLIKE
jgi:hypothetical protein